MPGEGEDDPVADIGIRIVTEAQRRADHRGVMEVGQGRSGPMKSPRSPVRGSSIST